MKRSLPIGLKWFLLIVILWASAVQTAYAEELQSNTPGYLPVSGTWSQQAGEGLKGVSQAGANAFNMSSTTVGTNFTYEADVKVDASSTAGVGSLVFRASEDGSKGYVLSLDPNLDRLRLFDYASGTNVGTPYSTTIDAGTSYHLKIVADGASIQVYFGSTLAISASDTKYDSGSIGYHVYNGTAYFQNVYVYETLTNLTGWNTSGGTWTPTSQGWKATAGSGQNSLAMSATNAGNFTYETDLLVQDTYAVASVLFRSNASGSQGYALQVDPNLDRLRLYKTNGDVTLDTKNVTIDTGKVYHLRIKAEGNTIKVYWQSSFLPANGFEPIMTVTDASFASGVVGLGVFNGSAVFQDIEISDLNTNLYGWTVTNGAWTPHLDGVKAVSSGAVDTFRMAENTGADFVLEGDLKVDAATSTGTAALVFRANAAASSGYILSIDPNLDLVRLFHAGSGNTIASASRTIDTGKTYHIEVVASGSSINVYFDGYAAPAISVTDTSYTSGRFGLNAYNGTVYFQNVYATDLSDWYSGEHRPQYHFTQPRSTIADPNGLVYYNGEYHLFHQGTGQWAHAVSTDLTHWKHLPVAIPWNDMGQAWSGSVVADTYNATGLFGGGSGLVAYYTSFNSDKPNGNQKVGMAYSSDSGRTWQQYNGNPVVQNPGGVDGGWDFRDPKVVWDGDHSKWIMVISGGDNIRFYSSTNLLTWTYESSFGFGQYLHGGVWECPDLFQLPVDGNPANKKWVLTISTGAVPQTDGSASEYFIGSFDGTAFTSDNPAGTVLRYERGKDMYAAVSYSGIPDSDGRRISFGWMGNWDYPFSIPTSPWNGQLSIPRVLSLTNAAGEGIRLVQAPAAELEALRGTASSWSNVSVTSSSANLLAGLSGTSYEIMGEFELPASGGASEFGFRLREAGDQKTVVGYNAANSKLFVNRTDAGEDAFTANFTGWQEAALSPENNRIKLRIFVDESSVEVFGNDGKAVFSNIILPDAARDGMSFYTSGGSVNTVSLSVYSLSNTWRSEPTGGTVPQKVIMDQDRLELGAGATERIYTTVLPVTAANKNVSWSSSNTSVAVVSAADSRSADVTAVGQGRAVITATTESGAVVGSTVVHVGAPFRTNLTGWASTPQIPWISTSDGLAGSYDKDLNNLSSVSADNFTYEADIKLDEESGAGSILFRSNSDGTSGYYFNVDPNLRSLRLFYILNGSFSSSQQLASVPAFVQAGKTYHVKIVTSGTNIKIYFDGSASPVIDVNDSTFSSGYFGLNAFGGRAHYQNVYWYTALDSGSVYKLINPNSGKALDASGSTDGANVHIWSYFGGSNQKWTLTTNTDGSYTLTDTASGKALDAAGTSDGSNVQIWQNLGYPNQKWLISPNDDGTYTLTALDSGKALDVSGAGTADGTNVQVYSSNGSAAQKWQLIKVTP